MTIDGIRLMASDGCDDKSRMEGVQLVISVATEAEAHQTFNALGSGGNVVMPLTKTFCSPCFGMVADKFNITWMVMVPGPQS